MTFAERRHLQLDRASRHQTDYPQWWTRQTATSARAVRLSDLTVHCRCGGAGNSDYLCAACGRVNEQFS